MAMSGDSIPLNYASPIERHRYFHVFMLPLIWLPACIGSRIYGDNMTEPLAFAPAIPVYMVLQSYLDTTTLLHVASAFTLLLVIAAGYLMDRIPVQRWIYFFFPPVLLLAGASRIFIPNFRPGLQSLPPPPPPAAWRASVFFLSWAITLYVFAFAAMFLGALTALIRTILRGRAR
jgi:hypothetical protein